MDYIFRRLALDYLSFEARSALGIYSAEERQRHLETGSYEPIEETGSAAELLEAPTVVEPVEAVEAERSRPRTPTATTSARCPPARRGGPHERRAPGEDHRPRRRLPALLHLRHQDAAGGQLLRLRGLRQHQRLQLIDPTPSRPSPDGPCVASTAEPAEHAPDLQLLRSARAEPDAGARRGRRRGAVRPDQHGEGPGRRRRPGRGPARGRLGPAQGVPADHRPPAPVQTDQVERHGKVGYWRSFWDGEDVFYGHVLGSKGLERACVVLCVNEEGERDRARSGCTSGCPAPPTCSSSSGTPK